MNYFCITCDKVICSDCVMFTKNHENHKFERIKSIFEKKIDNINKEMRELKSKIKDHDKYLVELTNKMDLLKKSKDDRVKDLL